MSSLVCIGFAEALAAPEVTWSLRDAGHDVVAFGRRGRLSPLRHSTAVTVFDVTPPEVDYPRAIEEVQAVLARYERYEYSQRAFFPLDDTAVFLSTRMRLSASWRLAGPAGDAAEVALDKTRQTKLAKQAGFSVPATTEAHIRDEVLARAGELPLILRPSQSVLPLGRGIKKGRNWICANQSELLDALSQWKEDWPLLVQPFVLGVGEGVFGLATATGVQALTGHRRLRMMNPHGSGSSACISQPVPAHIQHSVEEFIRLSNWRGLFMVELLRENPTRTWFIEFNGRTWGSVALSRRQGFEYPAWAVQAALDGKPLEAENLPRSERLVCQNAGRELVHLLFVLRGPRSRGLKKWPSFWSTVRDILRPEGRRRFYNWRRSDWKVFFSDCCYTVWFNVCKSKG